jgi:hypothetical protein
LTPILSSGVKSIEADVAFAASVGLMLSGHTHNSQLWPFG